MTSPQSPIPLRDSKSSLYEAALAAVKDREEAAARAPRPKPPKSRHRRVIALFLIGVAGAVLLLVRPTWLAGPDAPPPENPRIAAASLRLTLLRERGRIQDFTMIHGRLPATLGEAGTTLSNLMYVRSAPDAFTLTGQAGDSLITLRSSDTVSAFLGRSLRTIRERGRR